MRPSLAAYVLGATVVSASLAAACGEEENPAADRRRNPSDRPLADDDTTAAPPTGSRRISVHEYSRILADVLLDRAGVRTTRVEDTKTGYDNDVARQPLASPTYIEETEQAATEAAKRFVANPAAWAALVPCTPTGASDGACLGQFVGKVGRKLLRRTMTREEIDRYVSALLPFAVEKNDFKVGAELVVRTLLQDTEFLYIVQTTRPIPGSPGVVALTGPSRASALSFFLWGTTPDDALLDKGESGELDAPARVAETAAAMMDDPRAKGQIDRFVAMWFGYERNPAMTAELADEMNHVIERAVFERDADIVTLFTGTETYLPNEALASFYGLPAPPPGGGWVPYGATGRAGILSTGAVLTMGAKGADTSPTQRGKAVMDKVTCTPLERPANVNVDEPPAAPNNSPCKVDRYKAIGASSPSCAGCHAILDGVGLGLEAYDLKGRFRANDDLNPQCAIPGQGELPGVGQFKGPGELGTILANSGKLDSCIVKQVFRYGLAREESVVDDEATMASLMKRFSADKRSMKKLIVALVSSSTFLTVKE